MGSEVAGLSYVRVDGGLFIWTENEKACGGGMKKLLVHPEQKAQGETEVAVASSKHSTKTLFAL